MILYFGLQFDNQIFRKRQAFEGGILVAGPQQLLHILEKYAGLSGPTSNIEYLRVEKYRQSILRLSSEMPDTFFTSSFEADQMGTAETLLQMRDELIINDWKFEVHPNTPKRLQVLSKLERIYQAKLEEENLTMVLMGLADRFRFLLTKIKDTPLPFEKIQIYEPFELLPPHLHNLFKNLENQDIPIKHEKEEIEITGTSDLNFFQRLLKGEKKVPRKFQKDGSLQILTAERESEASAFFPRFLKANDTFQPVCLIPEQNRTLDYAFLQLGLPSMGIQTKSHARPILQILKLVPAFIWEPIDPYKLLEFVNLPFKPLETRLSSVIARLISSKPGLKSEQWNYEIARYFEWAYKENQRRKDFPIDTIRFQYQMWFDRTRYAEDQSVPKTEIATIFQYLSQWAKESFDNDEFKKSTFLVLAEQSKRIAELIEALPEQESYLDQLTLERIIRTIYEPSPVQFNETQIGFTSYFHHPGGIMEQVDQLVWWNFMRKDTEDNFSRWFATEVQYLNSIGIELTTAPIANQLDIWHSHQPVLLAKKQLIVVMPRKIEGEEVFPHALYDLLEAHFENVGTLCTPIESCINTGMLKKSFKLPSKNKVDSKQLNPPSPIIQLKPKQTNPFETRESLTSLENLIYYPYKWFFKRQARLRKSPILSIVKERTLLGNLAHRFFEKLLTEFSNEWDQQQTIEWIEDYAPELLAKEGVVFQMYGREPEKVAFLNRVKQSAWMLIKTIKNNNWEVVGTEQTLEGEFMGIPIIGYADLILQRDDEYCVVDLKWRGTNRRKLMLKNREDLQLVLYARLLDKDQWPHTAFYIIEEATMIARNQLAFQESIVADRCENFQEVCEEILEKMEKTLQWRIDQLKQGTLEIRTEDTSRALDEIYGGNLLELLEMKSENAPFDDYETLVN